MSLFSRRPLFNFNLPKPNLESSDSTEDDLSDISDPPEDYDTDIDKYKNDSDIPPSDLENEQNHRENTDVDAEDHSFESKRWDLFEITSDDKDEESTNEFWKSLNMVVKAVMCCVLFLLVFITSVLSKLSFLIIAHNINTTIDEVVLEKAGHCPENLTKCNVTEGGEKYALKASNRVVDIQWVWGMTIIICLPYIFTIFKCFKNFCFEKTRKLNKPCLFIALVLETIHSVGLGIFVYIVAPFGDALFTLTIIQSVTIVPSFFRCIPSTNKEHETKWRSVPLSILASLVHVGFLGVLCYRTILLPSGNFLVFAICCPVSILMISVVWWENFIPNHGRITSRQQWKAMSNFALTKLAVRIRRTKIDFCVNVWKLILNVAIPLAIFAPGGCAPVLYFTSTKATECSLLGNLTLVYNPHEFSISYLPLIMAAVNFALSGIGFKMAKAACKIRSQIACFSLPLVMTTPITFVLVLVSYKKDFVGDIFGPDVAWFHLKSDQGLLEFLETYMLTLWLPILPIMFLFFLITVNHIWIPGADRVARTSMLFSKPLYCGVFFDQSLILHRRTDDNFFRRIEAEDKLSKILQEKGYYDTPKDIEQHKMSLRKSGMVPLIYACATLWRENAKEMTQLFKSILRMDFDQFQKAMHQTITGEVDKDMYEFEAHIFFDDAFFDDIETGEHKVNSYVKQMISTLKIAVSSIHHNKICVDQPRNYETPYGGRLEWTLPGDNKLIVHLKDKKLIRVKKRWSQVMYMYYLLSFRLMCDDEVRRKSKAAENTYILALDGDVDFYPSAVQLLVDRMRKNVNLGAAAGRIHPIGSGPMVWYQQFEYSVSHWLQKATEHTIGCVFCSPGCFSLFRGSALMRDDVIKKYATVATEARHKIQFDMGEDRWLCTLLLKAGMKVEYCAAADAYTFCPETFNEFYKQRRRWTPSTMANILDILSSWKELCRINDDISCIYMFYQAALFLSSVLTPGTIFLLILGAFNTAYPDISLHVALIFNLLPVVIFIIMCYTASEDVQIGFAAVMSTIYSLVMMVVIVGLIKQIVESQFCSVTAVFFLSVVGIFFVSAVLHPREFLTVFNGIIYFLTIPSSSMLLIFYALGNLNNGAWGTRDIKLVSVSNPNVPGERAKGKNPLSGAATLFGNIKSKFSSDYVFTCGNLARCICCPTTALKEEDVKLQAILTKLEGLEEQLEDLAPKQTGNTEQEWNKLPYVASSEPMQRFSENTDIFVGSRSNPVYEDEQTKPDKRRWNEDPDLGSTTAFNDEETQFWKGLIATYLTPIELTDKQAKDAAVEMTGLRDKVCLFFYLSNALFVTIIYILESVSRDSPGLTIQLPCDKGRIGQKIEPISIAFTLIFGILLVTQFIAMMFHRFSTLLHIAATTEIRFSKTEEEVESLRMTAIKRFNDKRGVDFGGSIRSIDSVPSDITFMGTKAETRKFVKKLTRRQRDEARGKTDNRVFDIYRRNIASFQKNLVALDTENKNDQKIEKEAKRRFGGIPTKYVKTIVDMAKDDDYKTRLSERTNALSAWQKVRHNIVQDRRPEPKFLSVAEQVMAKSRADSTMGENNRQLPRKDSVVTFGETYDERKDAIRSSWESARSSSQYPAPRTKGDRSSLWSKVASTVAPRTDMNRSLLVNADIVNEGATNPVFRLEDEGVTLDNDYYDSHENTITTF
ncbi:hypothetical protein SNE40_022465 [Patella caerulea]|uniref:chitin synthase n=1 Tax=Patella caerulea TaxID=87958 RepID=A0AAN8IZN5_PATCE